MKTSFKLTLFICVCTACAILFSCKPETLIETVVETETITVNDTVIVSTTDTLIVPVTDTLIIPVTDTLFITDTLIIPEEAEVTNFILVRHAETSTVGSDPVLTAEGIARAEKLANMLSELELDRVYSTNFNRTWQTATPTADDQGLSISNYGGFDHDDVIEVVLADVNEGKVLIVGHSNTTPNFLNALTGTSDYPDLPEDAYDNIFIVNVKSKGDAEVIHLKY